MKLSCLFRNVPTACFTKQRQGYSYSYQMLLLFSTQQTTPTTARKPVAVYLMERLGFSEEESLAISKKFLRLRATAAGNHVQVTDLIALEKSDYVIAYLQEHCGLDLSHIKKAVTKYPTILAANVDNTIKPKVKLLEDLGFSVSDLALVLSRNPPLYLASDLTPAIQALRGILGSDDDKNVVKALKGLTWDTASKITKNLVPNVTMLENEYGFPRDKIRKFLAKVPKVMVSRTEWLREVLVRVEQKWGITRNSSQFLRAVDVVSGASDEKIDTKCQVFRSFGWSESDMLSLIRNNPDCLGYSEARLTKLLEFYMNEMGYDPAYLVSRHVFLDFSLENRVKPRQRVLSILKEKGLIKADYQLSSCLSISVEKFFDKFISPYDNVVPELRKVCINDRVHSDVQLHMEASENERETIIQPNDG